MSNSPKCYICEKRAVIRCANPNCDNQACNDHSYRIKHSIKCQDCFIKDRKKGRILIWSTVGVLFILLIVVIILRTQGIL